VRRRRAAFEPVDVDLAAVEVDLLPFEGGYLGGAEAVPVGQQHHECIARAVAIAAASLNQLLDHGVGHVFALAQSRFGGRRGGCVPTIVPFSVGGGTSRRFDFAMEPPVTVFMVHQSSFVDAW
jgi:hypothetical protein